MPNTYTQIYIHLIFAVENRDCFISSKIETKLYKYITGIIRNEGHKLLAINGMPDHVHILVNMKPTDSISTLVQAIKSSSSRWLNFEGMLKNKFSWQSGFGAFSYSKSQVDGVIKYIMRQKEHHKMKPFREEYLDFLKKFNVEYNDEYLFNWIDKYVIPTGLIYPCLTYAINIQSLKGLIKNDYLQNNHNKYIFVLVNPFGRR